MSFPNVNKNDPNVEKFISEVVSRYKRIQDNPEKLKDAKEYLFPINDFIGDTANLRSTLEAKRSSIKGGGQEGDLPELIKDIFLTWYEERTLLKLGKEDIFNTQAALVATLLYVHEKNIPFKFHGVSQASAALYSQAVSKFLDTFRQFFEINKKLSELTTPAPTATVVVPPVVPVVTVVPAQPEPSVTINPVPPQPVPPQAKPEPVVSLENVDFNDNDMIERVTKYAELFKTDIQDLQVSTTDNSVSFIFKNDLLVDIKFTNSDYTFTLTRSETIDDKTGERLADEVIPHIDNLTSVLYLGENVSKAKLDNKVVASSGYNFAQAQPDEQFSKQSIAAYLNYKAPKPQPASTSTPAPTSTTTPNPTTP